MLALGQPPQEQEQLELLEHPDPKAFDYSRATQAILN
jgi:hypothetical protein